LLLDDDDWLDVDWLDVLSATLDDRLDVRDCELVLLVVLLMLLLVLKLEQDLLLLLEIDSDCVIDELVVSEPLLSELLLVLDSVWLDEDLLELDGLAEELELDEEPLEELDEPLEELDTALVDVLAEDSVVASLVSRQSWPQPLVMFADNAMELVSNLKTAGRSVSPPAVSVRIASSLRLSGSVNVTVSAVPARFWVVSRSRGWAVMSQSTTRRLSNTPVGAGPNHSVTTCDMSCAPKKKTPAAVWQPGSRLIAVSPVREPSRRRLDPLSP